MTGRTPASEASRATDRLRRLWTDVADLDAAAELAAWDQEVGMPPDGELARARLMGTLAALKHERLSRPGLQEAVASAAALLEDHGDLTATGTAAVDEDPELEALRRLAADVREAQRVLRRATAIPESLARELATASSLALPAWQAACAARDFGSFAPALERIVRAQREKATAYAEALHADDPYDGLLDEFEPGMTRRRLDPLFDELRMGLQPLVDRALGASPVDESAARGRFPAEGQLALGRMLCERAGFRSSSSRIDPSAHPFCIGLAPGDVRLTWRWSEEDLRPGLYGLLHEMGHGLYEQGLPRHDLAGPSDVVLSLGLHESQSRLWENGVGRSLPFWEGLAPRLREVFPELSERSPEALWRAVNPVRASPIRVDADQITYNFHIVIRYELEAALLAGDLAISDLPEAWNRAYAESLEVVPRDDAEGVLQDVHWASGLFGYFPTYALGSLAAGQILDAARSELDLDAQAGELDLAPLGSWLRSRIHRHAAILEPEDLLRTTTGSGLRADAFLGHATALVDALYDSR